MNFNKGIHNFDDARKLAQKRLPWMVFDYIDGAAGTGHGELLNREMIRDIQLQPRILRNVEQRDLAVNVFNQSASLPFGISPMGMCNLATPGADLMLARLAAKHRIPVGVSTAASTSLEKMIETAQGHAWFQLYFSGNKDVSNQLIRRAQAAAYETLVLTVDVPEVGRRPRELRRGFKMPFRIGPQQFLDFACHPYWSLSTLYNGRPELANFGGDNGEFNRASSRAGADWELLEKIRDCWKGNLVVKGVLDSRDALKLKKMGVNAIQVSNHGGRQLDSAPPAIQALRKIRDTVGEDFPLFFDSGIRSGEDIIKAYAVGANFVFLGRAFSFALAGNGAQGLDQITNVLAEDISIILAQLGVNNMQSIGKGSLVSALSEYKCVSDENE